MADLNNIADKVIQEYFENYFDNYDHETYECNGTEYIKERSAERCVKDFKDDFDIDVFLQRLGDNAEFCKAIFEMVDKSSF